jgi:GABA permease
MVAAAETKNPEQSVAKATQSVITRVLLFYVCSIFLVVCLVLVSAAAIVTISAPK